MNNATNYNQQLSRYSEFPISKRHIPRKNSTQNLHKIAT